MNKFVSLQKIVGKRYEQAQKRTGLDQQTDAL